jgi:hypothetical protein
MAQQNKTTLKTYYQTGDIPTSGQYGELIDSSLNLAETALQVGEFSVSSSGNLKLLGSSSFVGDVTASADISASAASTITAGTASFSNLFAMNQAVTTTSNVTFNQISLNKTTLSSGLWGGTVNASGQSFVITISSIPEIAGVSDEGYVSRASTTVTINNSSVTERSVVMGGTTGVLSVKPFRISDGSFRFAIYNEGESAFTDASATFNFVVF